MEKSKEAIIASIDLGTNTVRFLVARIKNSRLYPVYEDQKVTRLGLNLIKTGKLSESAMERTLDVIVEFTKKAKQLNTSEIFIVGTSAIRRASNKEYFKNLIFQQTGNIIHEVSGHDEAKMTLLGVAYGLKIKNINNYVLIDIGGGSTEIIFSSGIHPLNILSIEMGVVNLTEKYLSSDPVEICDYNKMVNFIKSQISNNVLFYLKKYKFNQLIGTGGTITTIAALDQGLKKYKPEKINGYLLDYDKIKNILDKLLKMKINEIEKLPCLEPGRADVLIAGIGITMEVMRYFKINKIKVSENGLREGIIYYFVNREML